MSFTVTRALRFQPRAAEGFHRDIRRRVAAHLAAAGATRFADRRIWTKAAILVAAAALSYGAALSDALPGWARLIAAAGWGAATILLALNIGHDAAHDALVPTRWVNRLIHHATFALVGADAYLWRFRHVRSHHNFPNVSGCDIDIDENPFLRLSPHHPLRPWQRCQAWYAPLLYLLVGLHTALWGDLVYLRKRELATMSDIRHPPIAYIAFALGKAVWVAVTFVLPFALADRPWWEVLLGIGVASATASLIFITLLIGTHFAEEAAFPRPDAEGRLAGDWAEHTLRTSIDWGVESRTALWLTGGANCHVAHHLFPGLSHVHYPEVTRLIATAAAEHGLPYRRMSFGAMIASHLRHLHRLSAVGSRSRVGGSAQPGEDARLTKNPDRFP